MKVVAVVILAVLLLASFVVGGTTDQMTTLTGVAIYGSDTLSNCEVKITLAGASVFYTTTMVVPSYSEVIIADANGNFSCNMFGTDSLTAYGGGTPTYTIEYKHPILQKAGIVFALNGLTIPANGSTTALRDILAQ